MNVNGTDLSQLGAIEKAAPTSAEGAGPGDFSQILRSTLDEPGSPSSSGQETASEGQAESGNDSATGKRSSHSTKVDRGEDEDQQDESVVDGTVMAAIAVAAASARVEPGPAAVSESGRLTDLELERTNAALADRGRESLSADQSELVSGVTGRNRLSAEQAASVVASLEAKSARGGIDPRATLAVEAGPNSETRTRLGEGAQEPVEAPRGSREDSESRAQGLSELMRGEGQRGSGAGPGRERDDSGGRGRALFDRANGADRAADAARSQEVAAAPEAALVSVDPVVQAPGSIPLDGAGAIATPVAGTVTEMTTNTPAGAAASPAASEAILVQTEWLARHGGGTARILLSPPSLGEVAIQVTLRGGNVDVVMVVNEAAAQSVAENQSDRLAQAFSNHHLRMETFEVRRGDPQETANGDLGQFAESGSRDQDRAERQQIAERGPGSTSTAGNADLNVDGIEQLARPKEYSAGPEASVDLRI